MPYHILLVDDDSCFRSEFKEFMDDFDVIEAPNGSEALKILKKPNNVDLIILDEMMPGIKGTDLLNEIKKYAPRISTVILTGCGSKEVIIGALQGQATDFIEKPLNSQTIAKIKNLALKSPKGEKDKNVGGVAGKIEQAKYFAQRNYNKRLTLEDVADEVCLSPKYLSRLFKEHTGVIFSEYKLKLRMEKAKEILKNPGDNIEEIAHQLGYQNPGSFIKVFHKFNNCTPRQFRDRALLNGTAEKETNDIAFSFNGTEAIDITLNQGSLSDSPNVIFVTDRAGHILQWNRSAKKAYGWTEKEALTKTIEDLIPEKQSARIRALFKQKENGAIIESFAEKRLTKQGKIIDVNTVKFPVQSSSNSFFIFIDQPASSAKTQSSRATDRPQENSGQLNKLDPLSDVVKMASIVAHELRHPLSVIQMAVWNIRKKEKQKQIDPNLKSIEQMITDSEQIINSLMGCSHLIKPIYQPVKVDELIQEAFENVTARLDTSRVRFTKNIKAVTGTTTQIDRLLLKEVLSVILSGACAALPKNKKGKINLTAGLDNGYLLIKVQHDGKAIKSEDMDKVFSPFFSYKSENNGHGPAAVQNIIQLHNGSLDISDQPKGGAAVTLKIPLTKPSTNVTALKKPT